MNRILLIAMALICPGMVGAAGACTLSWDTNPEADMDHYEVVVQQMGAQVFFDQSVPHDPAQARTEVVVTPGDPAAACQDPAVYQALAVDMGGNRSTPGELQLDSPPGAPGGLSLTP